MPEEDWVVSERDGKVKKTIGKKYADFQISKYNVNAQPYYVLLDNEENILMPPRAYNLNADEFVQFLEQGIENFKEGLKNE
jgi:thiol:disulfide interchange protein DsbD